MKIKKILCPIDQSRAAMYALKFAIKLREKYDASLYVLHVRDIELGLNTSYKEKKQRELTELMKQFDINEPIHFFDGEIVKTINENSKGFDLIVMGLWGSHHSEKFYGSTAAQVIQTTEKPIFLIPEGDVEMPFHKISFASDFKDTRDERFEILRDLAYDNKAELDLIHVSETNSDLDDEESEEAIYLHRIFDDINHGFFKIENDNIINGIKENIDSKHPDLLAIMPRTNTKLSSTFSQAVINTNFNIPIFSFHA